ncbi:FAD-dependent oxidoreductase [Nocardioides sp. MAH-18]|uniref:FAD-dependent oxidoreductase n=1 Tax=Nocardioides agri TaxID=2682843 RepID=A0A6L6XMX1_9ACTN|nr:MULTISPECIES: flavin monoamine oxidase family protein [unclassified Nocardioides]MBA2953228.1 flavin monoamine oxidase family protein [Nocardioides sp. CGMCC 1.13656]MVQ48097.1 FAD-dependent oxidoreductase [Nocardioides sp. MAH-18]
MPEYDVVVVGAGLAGLAAARDLTAAGKRIVVLEARDRVGGRTDHAVTRAGVLEMGGQWVGGSQTEVLALIEELGLETFPQYDEGQRVTVLQGSESHRLQEAPTISATGGAALAAVIDRLDQMASTVSLSSPWLTGEAEVWDSMTFESWLVADVEDDEALQYLRVLVPTIFSAETSELSLLHFLFYVKSAGSLGMLMGIRGGAQESRVLGGSHRISERMAEDLGDAVRLGVRVHTIRHDDSGVRVAYDGGEVTAEHVIVTLPPTLAGRLRYEPPLPAARDGLTQQVPMGSVIKVQVVYERPFWREAGLSGQAFSTQDPLAVVIDNTPPGTDHGVLLGFFEGAHARPLSEKSPAEREKLAVDCLVRYFGPQAAEPLEYVEKDWSADEYSRGCYGGRLGAGVWTQYGRALAAPVGRIHWAGAESAEVWNGYMDGAIRSGRRAAAEVLA